MVTAELAVTTLAAFALLTTMCWGIYLVVTQLRCIDAAAIARQASAGTPSRSPRPKPLRHRSDDCDRERRAWSR